MTMLTVDLDEYEHRGLKLLALRRGTSMSRIVRDLVAAELAEGLTAEDHAATEQWTPATARRALGITDEPDPASRDRTTAAMAAAERRAEEIYEIDHSAGAA